MAGATIYLDVDDEITSAAARIRGVEGTRVAMVLPHGSRVATSRINFRLLARDAQEHLKRLSIVASDPATRALAASAGLPVFASVGEYEDALRDGAAQRGADAEADPGDAEVGPLGVAGAAGAAAAGIGSAGAASATDTGSLTIERSSPAEDPRAAAVGTAAAGADAAAGTPGPSTRGPVTAAGAPPGAARTRSSQPTAVAAADLPPAPVDARPGQMLSGDGRRGIGRGLAIGGLAILLLAVVVGGVSAYLLLPSATATVAARQETIGPLTMTISAATDVTSPDVTRGVVPAQRITVPVEASDTFPATGKRVELKAATGSVRFQNLDPTSQNTIGKGSIVSTPSGIRFRTNSTITIDAATLAGLTIVPATRSVKVTAVDQGPDGNVAPNSITSVPRGESPLFLGVTNPEATTGGSEKTFQRVTKKDVDAATNALNATLTTDFHDQLDDPALAGQGVTVFPDSANLGEATFTPNPDDLVGQEVATFDLSASATGTVIAVDEAPLQTIAETRLKGQVAEGSQLVAGSSDIQVDDAVVSGDAVSFPVVATAKQVRLLDAAAIQAAILGKPEAEARAILDGYGTSSLKLWPDWVSAVPTLGSRVDVRVEGPGPSPGPSPRASSPAGPSATP